MKNVKKFSSIVIILCVALHIGYIALQVGQRFGTDDTLQDVVNVESSILTEDEVSRLESLCEHKGEESHLSYYVRDQNKPMDGADLSKCVVIYLSDNGISEVQTNVKHKYNIQSTGSAYLDVAGAINSISAEQVSVNNSRYFDMALVVRHIKIMLAIFIGFTGVLYTINVWRSKRNGR